jgi:SAM-dependent methyltransferase
MKTRESGMPEEQVWAGFFDPEVVLRALGLSGGCGAVVDFGCGYGTFAIPAARIAGGPVYAFDIEPEMVRRTAARAAAEGLCNVVARQHDFISAGTGLPDGSVGCALLFNILHCEQPDLLLREALRVLAPGGRLAVMHWNHDPSTPRGPSMAIRPPPEQCRAWALEAGFEDELPLICLPPYHFGIVFRKPVT